MLGRYARFSDLFMDLSKHHGVGIFNLTKKSNNLTSSDAKKNLVYTEKLVGVPSLFFLILYVDDIL
jgi:hypothetical protein